MVQVKKESVKLRILDSAFRLFSDVGYTSTTLQDIASDAGLGVGGIYSYFNSKLELFYDVFDPWQDARYSELETRLRALTSSRDKLRAIFLGIWRDIPMENIMLANGLMEALSSTDLPTGKPSTLLHRAEKRVEAMLSDALRHECRTCAHLGVLPNLILMAYDGFVINSRLNDVPDLEILADSMSEMVLSVSVYDSRLAERSEV